MKVIICGPYPYHSQKIVGGVEAVVKNIHDGIGKYAPTIHTEILSRSTEPRKKFEKTREITYIKKPTLKVGTDFLSIYPHRVKKAISKLECDVLHAHTIDFGYYGLKMRDKLLFTLHGIIWEEKKFMPKYKQAGWSLIYLNKIKKILKNLKYLVSTNPYTKELLEDKTNATIFDICNPVPDKLFKIKNNTQENRLLYIGSISKLKNLLALIKALTLVKEEIKDFKLAIAGRVVDINYFNTISNYVSKNELNENIDYLGIIENQKDAEFSKMSFLVLPSLQETAPMVISEAFAAGKPVIASDIGGIPYMVNNNKNGFLIDPKNERDIANKILYSMENPSTMRAMGLTARKYAENFHSMKNVIELYKNAYEHITT